MNSHRKCESLAITTFPGWGNVMIGILKTYKEEKVN